MEIYEISKQLGIKKEADYRWSGVYATGKFDAIFDYNVGLVTVFVSVIAERKDVCEVMFGISTIDDGVWQALGVNEFTREEAFKEAERVARAFEDFMNKNWKFVLPTEKGLNDFLCHLGYWGEYTG